MNFKLEQWNGVPIAEERKQERIAEAIEWLRRHPDQRDTSVLSGDTMVVVEKAYGGGFRVYECMVRRHGVSARRH